MKHTIGNYVWLYAKFCGMLLFLIFAIGFVCPMLISANDTFVWFLGFIVLLAVPPAVGVFGYHVWQHFTAEVQDVNVSRSKRKI